MRTFCAFLVTLALQAATTPQNPPASVEGTVVVFDSNDPIQMSVVELRRVQAAPNPTLEGVPPGFALPNLPPGAAPEPPLTVMTNDAGAFRFAEVSPGEYRLYAMRETGYTPAEYGQRSPSGAGIPLRIEAGGSYTGIRLSMAPTGAIGGRVLLANGEPAEYARIGLLRASYRDGNPGWVIAQATTSDDRGAFRFYALPPGKYWVSAQFWDSRSTRVPYTSEPTVYPNRFAGQQTMGAPLVIERVLESGETIEEFVRRVYYPGTAEEKAAQAIVVRPGEQVQGIDFSLATGTVRSRRLRGIVIDAETGKPAAGAIVRLTPRQLLGAGLIVPSTTAGPDGTFEVKGMTSGSYSMLVTFGRGGNAYTVIAAGEADVDIGKVVATQGVDVPWRALFDEGIDDAAIAQLRIMLVRDPDVIGPTPVNMVVTAGWTGPPQGLITPQSELASNGFTLRNVPFGEYRVRVLNLPSGTYLRSIRRAGEDVLRDGMKILGADNNPLEIVIGRNGGRLQGRVVNQAKQPEANVPVVLVPALDRYRGDLYRKATTDGNGVFRFAGVAPGQYKIFAWEDVLDGAWQNADFLRNFETRGVSVDIQAASPATTEVEVIPWSENQ